MNTDTTPRRTQKVAVSSKDSYGWTEITALSTNTSGELSSTARVRTKEGTSFIDLSIEEYAGMSRRAKFTSVRFDEEAARAMHLMLCEKFGKQP
jgi:hypothetical protein